MAVRFDPAAVPNSIVWVVSRSDDRQEVLREEVELDGDLSVRRKVNRLSAAFAGFAWTWPD